jgi:hypothetical protein
MIARALNLLTWWHAWVTLSGISNYRAVSCTQSGLCSMARLVQIMRRSEAVPCDFEGWQGPLSAKSLPTLIEV